MTENTNGPRVSSTSVEEGVYDASAIQVLEGLEAVRKRPGMYIGSTGERGLHHLVYEIVDNSVDEALAGYCDTITVTLLPGDGVRVTDNGRGFPVDLHPKEKIPAVTLALTVLHAGGKFGAGGYKVSGGLHGVGASVVNALSDSLSVDVRRDGYHWHQSFSLGVPDADLQRGRPLGPDDQIGTTVTFHASTEIFETTTYNWDTLATRFREMAFLNKGLTIRLVDERPLSSDELKAQVNGTGLADFEDDAEAHTREVTFRYDDGLIDFVKYLTGTKETIHPSVIAIDAESADDQLALEV
ncbi:ATP-binding protein, partial [Propioniciclava sp.]|uniref:ATP-binding protein n=1 Tax=Propioniciclava sp. TaxID=2038686 RepID=UPI00260AC90E